MAVADLSLRHLRALAAVLDEGTYRRAADALGYSQAAITQQVAAAENALGSAVFLRHGGPRPMTLTPFGQEIVPLIRDMLVRADELAAACRVLRQDGVTRLSIGTFQSVSTRLLPQVLADLRRDDPHVDIDVMESEDNDELIESLLTGRLDVTFLVGPVEHDRLAIREVCTDPFVAMVSRDREIGGTVALAELAGTPLIGHQDCGCHAIVREGLAAAGIDATFVFRSNDNGAVQAMARADLGVAVMPLLSVDPSDPDVRIVPLDPPLPERRILIALPARHASPRAIDFAERVLT